MKMTCKRIFLNEKKGVIGNTPFSTYILNQHAWEKGKNVKKACITILKNEEKGCHYRNPILSLYYAPICLVMKWKKMGEGM